MLAVFAFALLVIVRVHFPIEHFYFDDENFVLPERVWFSQSWDWLLHLLFFNQTRYTWVGDFILVRPGLFGWMWLQDVLFRSNRYVVQVLICVVHILVFSSAFLFLRRSVGALLAACFALFAVTCVIGRQLYTWPHINGYVVSMVFYVLAAHLFLKEKPTLKVRVATAISFFLACAFYELTALVLPILLLIEKFSKRKKKDFFPRLMTLTIPLFAFGIVVLFAQFVLRPHDLSALDEMAPIENAGIRAFWVWVYFLKNLAFVSLPFPSGSETVAWLKTVVFLAGIFWLSILGWKRMTSEMKRSFLMASVPILALVLGVGLGRVGPRAVIKEHYFPLFHFFIWLTLAIPLSQAVLRSRLSQGVLLAILLGSVGWTALWIEAIKAGPTAEAEAMVQTVAEIRTAVRSVSGCFAGWADFTLRESQNATINSALLEESCARHPGKPVFVQSYDKTHAHLVEFHDTEGQTPGQNLLPSLQAQVAVDLLQTYLTARPRNLAQAKAGSQNGLLQIRTAPMGANLKILKAQWNSKDEWPPLWNGGLSFESGPNQLLVLLRDNLLELFTFRDGKQEFIVSSPLFSVEGPLELKVVKAQGPFCRFYVNSLLIFQFAACPVELSKPGVIQFDNGTPPEELQSLISQ